MELRLTNYKDILQVDVVGNPPKDDWRMVKENGIRKIVRDLRVQRNFIIEDFSRYVKKDFLSEYKTILENIGIRLAGKKKIVNGNLGDMYIYRNNLCYYVRIRGKYVGRAETKEEAIKIRDGVVTEMEEAA